MLFKKQQSPILKKAKEERIIFEAIYNFFGDGSIRDEMITIGRVYHDGDDFTANVIVEPFILVFNVTYDAACDRAIVKVYRQAEEFNNE